MANTDRARKLLVRSALVTSTTIATLIGAQNLALLDINQFNFTAAPIDAVLDVQPVTETTIIQQVAPELVIRRAAPSIIILRQAGQGNTTTALNIQPPVPSQIAAPAPMIVQQQGSQQSNPMVMGQPASVIVQQRVTPQRSRSSR